MDIENKRISPLDRVKRPLFDADDLSENTTVILAMTDKAFRASQAAGESRDKAMFQYTTALVAFLVIVVSDGLRISGSHAQLAMCAVIVCFTMIGSVDCLIKHKQARDLLSVLVHLENILGCYKPGVYVENSTLLPVRWLKTGGTIGPVSFLVKLGLFWLLCIAGCLAILQFI